LLEFLVDNVIWDRAAWACETNCWVNHPNQNPAEGLGELEIKPETLRFAICWTRDVLENAEINIEQWLTAKAARAFSIMISGAVLNGTGRGMPLGILRGGFGVEDTAGDAGRDV
jgi:HK97 family phage major capsid protein